MDATNNAEIPNGPFRRLRCGPAPGQRARARGPQELGARCARAPAAGRSARRTPSSSCSPKVGKVQRVVMQGSANLTLASTNNQWNDIYTHTRTRGVWRFYSTVFREAARDKKAQAPVRLDGLRRLPADDVPARREEGRDPVMQLLNKVKCRGRHQHRVAPDPDPDRPRRDPAGRAAWAWRGRSASCGTAAVTSRSATPSSASTSAGCCGARGGRGPVPMKHLVQDFDDDGEFDNYFHLKAMSIVGNVGGDRSSYVVLNGSANWSGLARVSDENLGIYWDKGRTLQYQEHIDYWYTNFPKPPSTTGRRRPAGARGAHDPADRPDQLVFGMGRGRRLRGRHAVLPDRGRPLRQRRPGLSVAPATCGSAASTTSGVAVVTTVDRPVDVCVDGRRVWTFWTRRDTDPVGSPSAAGRGRSGTRRGRSRCAGTWTAAPGSRCATRPPATCTSTGDVALGERSRGRSRSATSAASTSASTSRAALVPTFAGRSDRDIGALLDADRGGARGAALRRRRAVRRLRHAARRGPRGRRARPRLRRRPRLRQPRTRTRSTWPASPSRSSASWPGRAGEISRYSGASFKIYVTEADVTRGLDVFGGFLDDGRLLPDGRDRRPSSSATGSTRWAPPSSTAGRCRSRPGPRSCSRRCTAPAGRCPTRPSSSRRPTRTIRAFDDWFRGIQPGIRHWEPQGRTSRAGQPLRKTPSVAGQAGREGRAPSSAPRCSTSARAAAPTACGWPARACR